MCGEKDALARELEQEPGSPPRVRGKVDAPVLRQNNHGITPACAGKSRPQMQLDGQWQDHPRVCGEKLSPVCTGMGAEGSPPRVRGKDLGEQRVFRLQRITPTCAGKR